MEKLHSYPKLYNIGHRAVHDLFKEEVLIQEKVDGSQISFGVDDGVLKIRSKGAIIYPDAPEKMFRNGVKYIQEAFDSGALPEGWVYRGEYLRQPKHNVIKYSRVPDQHIVIYDIETKPTYFLDPEEVQAEATRLGFDYLEFQIGKINSADEVRELLNKESFLGGADVEGIVIKNYARYTPDGKTMMGKFVSEKFKEVHRSKVYKVSNKDIIAQLTEAYATEARWAKAVHHLRDMGELEHDPRDIGKLLKEVNQDVLAECEDEIKDLLFKWGWKQLSKGLTRGFAEWYKQQLLDSQFEE
ncbi:MAG: RNA ligase family protein [Candidatus Thorarchaeota archaeon]|jgi:hypothetical protein